MAPHIFIRLCNVLDFDRHSHIDSVAYTVKILTFIHFLKVRT